MASTLKDDLPSLSVKISKVALRMRMVRRIFGDDNTAQVVYVAYYAGGFQRVVSSCLYFFVQELVSAVSVLPIRSPKNGANMSAVVPT